MTLTEIANACGTDKGTAPNGFTRPKGYTRIYERFLKPRRDEALSVLEIGVRRGASLAMWLRYLPRATVVGLDIDPSCPRRIRGHVSQRGRERLTLVTGDQADPDVLQRCAGYGPFDLVVDDGSHQAADIEASFGALWPHVRPRGVYAVEDLHADWDAVRPWVRYCATLAYGGYWHLHLCGSLMIFECPTDA